MNRKKKSEKTKQIKKEGAYVKFCPRCKSLDVKLHGLWFFGFPPSYKCKKCGYTSNFFPEIELERAKRKNK